MKKLLPFFILIILFSFHTSFGQCPPVAGGISGADSICFGETITLTSFGASATGTWMSDDAAVATVAATGGVTATATAPATTTIRYVVTSVCGSDTAAHVVYIKRSSFTGTISGPTSVCNGSTISLGGVNAGGVWSSADGAIATVTTSGIVGGGAFLGGTTTISYTYSTFSCGSAVATTPITVLTLPARGNITGADTICQNSFDTLRNHSATPGGTWRSRLGYVLFLSATSGIDTIMFKGITQGIDTIVYTVTTPCGADSATFTVKINALPLDGAVTGPTAVCVGSQITLADPTGTPGGSWSTSDATKATVNSITGVVTGTGGGPVVITYSGSTACGSIPDPYTITVNPVANAVISPGVNNVCIGGTATLVNTGSFGTGSWSSSNTSRATVDATTGVMGGISVGTATITYITTTPTCGIDTATLLITVNPIAYAGVITGADTVCYGATTVFTDLTPSGVWSSANTSVATVSSAGIVGGASATMATTTISYTVVSATCGTAATTHTITVKPLPVAGTLSGSSTVCAGATTTLTSTIAGGVWSSPSALVAVNAATGAVTGIATGTALISYAVTTSCGTAYATTSITVTGVPVMTAITGIDSVCSGATRVFTSAPAGGVWSVRFGLISIPSTTATTATILGVSGGIDTLTYTATNVCGSASVSKPVRALTMPAAGYITGTDSLCPGSSATLGNPSGTPGGIWSHSGTHISLTAGGVVTALFPATDTVFYTVTNSCGTTFATHLVTVNPLPVAGSISGPSVVCVGASISLSNTTGTPGGTWTCGAGGTITASGVFTGTAPGLVTATYAASTNCGTLFTYHTVSVNPLPTVAAITGTTTACAGTSATLSNSTSGGVWSCTPSAIATINSVSGVWGAAAPGIATVSYALTNACGTTTVTQAITVTTVPVVAAITGASVVCATASTTLANITAGGVWSVTNTHATISATGVVTGVSGGIDTVYYTVTNTCGSTRAIRIMTINAAPGATDSITGPAVTCIGSSITLACSLPGGVWSASNGHATVTGGVVTGVTPGIDTIRYAVANACGTGTLIKIITISAPVVPAVAAIVSPNDTICGTVVATYTALPVNGGSSPFIQWKRGGVNIGTGLTHSELPNDGDIITCKMASNAACRSIDTVTSNSITMHLFPAVIPIVTITASPNDTIAYIGQPITFSATLVNCGATPAYQWYKNGIVISGATNATYNTTATGSDAFYCIAACSEPCAIAVYNHSNTITLYTGRVGIADALQPGLSCALFPNPNTGSFTISGNIFATANETLTYEVIDMLGRIVYAGNTHPLNGVIDQQIQLPVHTTPGQYVLRLTAGSGTTAIHFVVNK